MKPHFHLVPGDRQNAYMVRRHTLPNFGTVWHYHPELEFHYIIRGEGIRLVGDNISEFQSGEMLMLGQNLPHMWRCNETYFQNDPSITAEAIVIHFMPDFIGKDFLNKDEAKKITNLYEKASTGLVIEGETKAKLLKLMREIVNAQGLDCLIMIMSMLNILSDSNEVETISSSKPVHHADQKETDRLNKIYSHTMSNFNREISLEEISAVACLSVSAFCRYFKMMTKKTYHQFLLDIRISNARRMLIENKSVTVDAIGFECGFNNMSNFYRHFKSVTGFTPLEYKHKFLYGNVFS